MLWISLFVLHYLRRWFLTCVKAWPIIWHTLAKFTNRSQSTRRNLWLDQEVSILYADCRDFFRSYLLEIDFIEDSAGGSRIISAVIIHCLPVSVWGEDSIYRRCGVFNRHNRLGFVDRWSVPCTADLVHLTTPIKRWLNLQSSRLMGLFAFWLWLFTSIHCCNSSVFC